MHQARAVVASRQRRWHSGRPCRYIDSVYNCRAHCGVDHDNRIGCWDRAHNADVLFKRPAAVRAWQSEIRCVVFIVHIGSALQHRLLSRRSGLYDLPAYRLTLCRGAVDELRER